MQAYGFHRVISPEHVFPQQAERLSVALPIDSTELLIDVEALHIDSNSYRQIGEACLYDAAAMTEHILAIIKTKGKMHNPVTGSGGMLVGTVKEIGKDNKAGHQIGDKIATLVSLTLTPLHIESILNLDPTVPVIPVKGYAILFQSAPSVALPDDMPMTTALTSLDVCGAAKLAQLYCSGKENILVLGAGKSGLLAAYSAYDAGAGTITIVEKEVTRIEQLKALGMPFRFIQLDVRAVDYDPALLHSFDLVLDCMNMPGCEMASILYARKDGTIIFFNTATTFTKAVLGAEGIGSQVQMIMGNGFYPGHAELTFKLLRQYSALHSIMA